MQRNVWIRNLGVVLLVLVGIGLARTYVPEQGGDTDRYRSQFIDWEVQQVTALSISRGEEEIVMDRDGGAWKLGDDIADATEIADMLTKLITPVKAEMVSETDSRHGALGVDQAAVKVTLRGDQGERGLMVGGMAPEGRYVRFVDEDSVYLVYGLAMNMTSLDKDAWIDKVLARIPEEGISNIELAYLGGVMRLEQREGIWYREERAVDRDSISGMVNTLDSLVTQGLADEAAIEVTRPTVTVKVEQEGGVVVELAFYEGTDEAIVTSSERVGKYVVSESLLDNFKLTERDLVWLEIDEAGGEGWVE